MKRSLMIAMAGLALIAAACGGTSTTTAAESTTTTMAEMSDIVETAEAAGNFTTLLTAVEAAGLVETLKGEGPYTVFAPTDEAFAALPEGTLESLLADTDALSNILLYHVVSGNVSAADVGELDEATSVQGSTIDISVEDGNVFVDGAQVITTDIMTSNGVIHVIDAVIVPA